MRYHVYLIRHGKTEGNMRQEYIGATDESLALDGRKELLELKNTGKYPEVDYVYVSPMRRCLETKDILYPEKPWTMISELRECNFGTFEQKTYEDLKDNKDYRKWLDHDPDFSFPGGEKPGEFVERCGFGFSEAVSDIIGKDIRHSAFIIHGGTIMSILDSYSCEVKAFFDWHTKNGYGYHVVIDKDQWLTANKIWEVSKLWDEPMNVFSSQITLH